MYQSHAEIFNQNESLERTLKYLLNQKEAIIDFIRKNKPDEIVFIACGSSYWLSLSSAMTMTEKTGIRCMAVKSGDIVLNPEYYQTLFKKPLVIAPSRSGSTSETLMAIALFKKWYSAPVLSIVGFENAPILAISDMTLELNWINEISICQTRAFSNLYMASLMIGTILGKDEKLMDMLENYLKRFIQVRTRIDKQVKSLIHDLPDYKALCIIANGKQYGVAIEGAYINVEMAQFPSHYYGTLELRHGPIVMIDSNYLTFIFCKDKPNDYEVKLIAEIKKAGGETAIIAAEDANANADFSFIYGTKSEPEIVALFGVFVLQALAYYKAVQLGLNPDQPKELVQWIKI
jgi:glutamine---fructose-6-phosphate transaminase (isomerizing)